MKSLAVRATGILLPLVLLMVLLSQFTYSQDLQHKTDTVGEDIFLPYFPGKIVNKITKGDLFAQQLFSILQTEKSISTPVGYEVEMYSDGSNRSCTLYLMPYLLEDGEIVRSPGSSVTFSFNDVASLFGPTLSPEIESIYTPLTCTGNFMGFPVYKHEGREVTTIYKSKNSLFKTVSREEYLTALLKAEEKKQTAMGQPANDEEYRKEIEKVYQELLKTDKTAAAEFKKEMDQHLNSRREPVPESLAAFYKKELAQLSSAERKQQALYAIYAMEKYGNYSGLVPATDSLNAQALVQPNFKAIPASTSILHLLAVKWKLSTIENRDSPGNYRSDTTKGYHLTDSVAYALYQNADLWKRISAMIK